MSTKPDPLTIEAALNHVHEEKPVTQFTGKPGGPQVGIFWLWNGRLLLEGVALAEAETYGRFLNYPDGHDDVWCRYQRVGVVPEEIEYAVPPRGRVLFDTVASSFLLYADACILRDERLINAIRDRLNLPAATTAEPDEHYRCNTCLGLRDDGETGDR